MPEETNKEVPRDDRPRADYVMPSNVIHVGIKPFSRYVYALGSMLLRNETEIIIRARGRTTSKALDLMEFAKRIHGLKCDIDSKHITIKSEQLPPIEGRQKPIYVTSLEIKLMK